MTSSPIIQYHLFVLICESVSIDGVTRDLRFDILGRFLFVTLTALIIGLGTYFGILAVTS